MLGHHNNSFRFIVNSDPKGWFKMSSELLQDACFAEGFECKDGTSYIASKKEFDKIKNLDKD